MRNIIELMLKKKYNPIELADWGTKLQLFDNSNYRS